MDQQGEPAASADSSSDEVIAADAKDDLTITKSVVMSNQHANDEVSCSNVDRDCDVGLGNSDQTGAGPNNTEDQTSSKNLIASMNESRKFTNEVDETVAGSNDERTDAELIGSGGVQVEVAIIDQEISKNSSTNVTYDIAVHNKSDCGANHDKEMEIDREKSQLSDERGDETSATADSTSLNEMSGISEGVSQSIGTDKRDSPVMEIDSDIHDKEVSMEKNVELEKTEFIQILQDKADDSQIEAQSMDAEDPFGGDSLVADTVEPSATDELQEESINFRKLADQADNLQDVLRAKDSNFESVLHEPDNNSGNRNHDNEIEFISEIPKEGNEDISNDSVGNKIIDDSQSNTNQISTTTGSDSSKISEKISEDNNKNVEVDGGTNASVRVTDEQSTVLPGQDDELCIIPDNLKIILPQKSTEPTNIVDIERDRAETSGISETPLLATENVNREPCILSEISVTENKDKNEHEKDVPIEQLAPVVAENIINLDDDSKNPEVEEISTPETCAQCRRNTSCKIKVKVGTEHFCVCSKNCQASFSAANHRASDIPSDGANSKYEKRCASCLLIIEKGDERNLSWETMEFCNEECLGKFQTKYGSYCRNCNGNVAPISLGKYCVRFGYDVRQFCCSSCLEEFKKGLKVCSYCQKDISSGTDGFLAPVGDKGQFKDFCTQFCMEKYSKMNSTEPPSAEKKACSVCQEEKIVHCEVQVDRSAPVAICSEPCFAAFKFVNKVDPDQCSTCKKYFDQISKKSTVVFYDNEAHTFCNKTCLNIFIITHRKIVPCNWCKVKKYNFDMIKKELKTGQVIMMCSLNCLTLYQVSINAVSARRINCDFCKEFSQAQYHLTMSDATIRNFCCYECVMKFQSQYTKSPITIPAGDDPSPVPTGTPKRTYPGKLQTQSAAKKIVDIQNLSTLSALQNKKNMPVISSVTSLASNGPTATVTQKSTSTMGVSVNNATMTNSSAPSSQSQIIYKQQVITRPPSPVKIHNKMTQCQPLMHTKGVSVKPHPCTKSTQTDEVQKVIIPIPVPIYVPFPIHMWSFPFPVPVPFPLPIPVPIFIPTTRNSTKGILKEIKRIQEKMPADPFEAELLMMAEMVATEKKASDSDSDSSEENDVETEVVDSGNTFGDDMLQMALRMATGEIEEPAVDLEVALTPNTITASQTPVSLETALETPDSQPDRIVATRGKKRVVSQKSRGGPTKRGRRAVVTNEPPLMPPPESQPPPTQPRVIEPIEKPDANMALKYTFGVNAWRKWVVLKNTELEKQNTPPRKVKLFKTDLLQLTADELNYSLCLFVKEVRKPNGSEYAPDTIYYLCLGIQQYLFENNRIDNIFTDTYYEQFTDCLNDVAKKFSVLYNDAQYIVTRVEEEHLWECKQLGAHSPHVLLSTLMFFNTKHFNLVTVDEHMQLSFSHIMKHWKRNPAAQTAAVAGKAPGSRNVLLRFYPPQSALEANSKKKKVYEQQENEENPLRCPVKLYEFYLSKCPESVKTRNDVFYLLPERSCVPDSPVWYSTSPLAKENLVKMLHRVKMVKEINMALLST